MPHQTSECIENCEVIISRTVVIQPRLFALSLESLEIVQAHLEFPPQSSLSPWLVFNLCDDPLDATSQCLNCGWVSTLPRCPIPNISHVFRVVEGVVSWLKLSPKNKVLLVCADGKARCSIVAAVYLRYAMIVHHCFSGFSFFHTLLVPPVHVSTRHIEQKPLLESFLTNADRWIIENSFNNDRSECSHWLAGLVLDGLLVEHLPVLEVWSKSQCIFSSLADENMDACSFEENNDSCVAIYKTNVFVPEDFALKVYFGGDDISSFVVPIDECDVMNDRNIRKEKRLIFRYIANPELLEVGSNEVSIEKLSIQETDYVEMLSEGGFDMSLFISKESIEKSDQAVSTDNCHKLIGRATTIDSFRRGLVSLSDWLCPADVGLEARCCREFGHIDPILVQLLARTCSAETDVCFVLSRLDNYLDSDVFQLSNDISSSNSQALHVINSFRLECSGQDETRLFHRETLRQEEFVPLSPIFSKNDDKLNSTGSVNKPYPLLFDEKSADQLTQPEMKDRLSINEAQSSSNQSVTAYSGHHTNPINLDTLLSAGSQVLHHSLKIDEKPLTSSKEIEVKQRNYDKNVATVHMEKIEVDEDNQCESYETRVENEKALEMFSKMIRMHVPQAAVEAKMIQQGYHPDLLNSISDSKTENTSCQVSDETNEKQSPPLKQAVNISEASNSSSDDDSVKDTIIVGDDPRFQKYFKMLKMHVPKAAILAKMEQEGLDVYVLDMNPNDRIPVANSSPPQIAIKDDVRFDKFFKMLKMHIPKEAVAAKMQQTGLDPCVLDMDPNLPVPMSKAQTSSKLSNKNGVKTKDGKSNVRRKRLHWSGVNKVNLKAENNIWSLETKPRHGEETEELLIDDNEFKKLFVAVDDVKNSARQQQQEQAAEDKSQKAKVINVINDKRAMNCDIALARVKMSHELIVHALNTLEGKVFTVDQLISLAGFLPGKEEKEILLSYLAKHKDDQTLLGGADRFMIQMMKVADCKDRYLSLTNQKHFPVTFKVCFQQVELLSQACSGVKQSQRLRKLLSFILKLGNKLNEGSQEVSAVTIDSLLKLRDSKAFDKKTSVMQYLVRLLLQQDPNVLEFYKDLSHLREASSISISSLFVEISNMKQNVAVGRPFVSDSMGYHSPRNFERGSVEEIKLALVDIDVVPYSVFIQTATQLILALETEVNSVDKQYKDLLSYVGEDPELTSEQFFGTLNQFCEEMESTIAQVKEMILSEERKTRRIRELQEKRKHAKITEHDVTISKSVECREDREMTTKEVMTAKALSIRQHCADSDEDSDNYSDD